MRPAATPKAEKVVTVTTPRRTMRARLFAYLWRNRAYVAAWTDGAICGVILFVVANVLMGGK
jgi:uncharacterized protein YchJ